MLNDRRRTNYSDPKFDQHILSGEKFVVKVELIGQGVDESHEFLLLNPPNGPLEIRKKIS